MEANFILLIVMFVVFILLFLHLEYLWRNQYFVSDEDFMDNLILANREQKEKILAMLKNTTSEDFKQKAEDVLTRIKKENKSLKQLCKTRYNC